MVNPTSPIPIEKKETPEITIENQKTKKEKFKFNKKWLFVLIPLIIIVVIISSSSGSNYKPNLYSADQMKVINAFGTPESFVIVTEGAGDTYERIESWKYLDLNEVFSFKNGEFVKREHIDLGLEGANFYHLKFEPDDFYYKAYMFEIEKMMKTEPSKIGTVDESVLDGETKLYSYDDWLLVGELDGKVVYIEQKPMLKDDTFQQTDVTDDLTNYVHTNNKYGFSFKMGTHAERLIEKEIDFGQDYTSYIYCYVSSLATDDSYCGQDSYPVFSIDVMNSEQYQTNIVEDPFGDMYEELGSDNNYYYMYSHPNGDLPSDSPYKDMYQNLQKTFTVKEDK